MSLDEQKLSNIILGEVYQNIMIVENEINFSGNRTGGEEFCQNVDASELSAGVNPKTDRQTYYLADFSAGTDTIPVSVSAGVFTGGCRLYLFYGSKRCPFKVLACGIPRRNLSGKNPRGIVRVSNSTGASNK